MMISRDMDIKDLINSSLFYPQIWTQHSLYSPYIETEIFPYNNEVEDLEYENPNKLFLDKK